MQPLAALDGQRGHLFAWVPVCLGLGIGVYFALPVEPGHAGWAALAGGAVAGAAIARFLAGRAAPVLTALVLVAAGVLVAGARAQMVAAPVLEYRYYGAMEGRIVAIDRSLSDKTRLTLDHVWLGRVPAAETPARIRVSLHGRPSGLAPEPGLTVMLTGHLSPPPGPAEPGGFDFRRRAWFEGLGAVGYTRSPVLAVAEPEGGPGLALNRLRQQLSAAIRARMPGEPGAFAAAILTGDRAHVARDTLDDLRGANLSHLLAISGLHMGLLTGFVFAALRYGMALIPPLALRVPVRKLAAAAALAAGAAYLGLSGGNVATERAFVMVAVVLLAVLFDRRALTLRAVALAALIVLLRRPENLVQPGFQMSFAATTALVAAFGGLRGLPAERWRLPRWLRPPLAVVLSSAVAGAATAPIAAAHFNRLAQFGLLANVLSVPVMGALVIPAAVVAALAAPVGLAGLPLWAMRMGIGWILAVADRVAGIAGSVRGVVAPGPAVLPLLALGFLWFVLWRGRARLVGLAPMLAAFALWSATERPALLIAESGRLAGVMTPQGRALTKPRGDGFVARSWLENDGDLAVQPAAAGRGGIAGGPGTHEIDVGGARFLMLGGRGMAERARRRCTGGWLILPKELDAPLEGGCTLIDAPSLARSGTLAVYAGPDGPRFVAAKERAGRRPWTPGR